LPPPECKAARRRAKPERRPPGFIPCVISHISGTDFAEGDDSMSIGPSLSRPSPGNSYHGEFVARVAESFAHVTGRSLYEEAGLDPRALGRSAWEGGFALLTHRGDAGAMLNYGNDFALRLWECDWEGLVALPSAATAPPDDIAGREDLMRRVAQGGFASGYSGRRISRTGRLFMIENATVWRLIDRSGDCFGVGAFFRDYRYLQCC
jgi:hypothetical protein